MSERASNPTNYFISMTDLLVGTVFILLVLIMIVQVTAGEHIDRLDREATLRVEARYRLMQQLVEGMEGAKIYKGAGVIRFPADLLFDENSAEPRPRAVRVLRTLATRMQRELPCFGATERRPERCASDDPTRLEAVYIEGHTDNFPARGRTNWELSSARAISTYNLLRKAAPTLEAVRNGDNKAIMLGISAYADTRPVREAPTAGGIRSAAYTTWRRDNRRIEFRFLLAAPTRDPS